MAGPGDADAVIVQLCHETEPHSWGHHYLDRGRRLAQDLDFLLEIADAPPGRGQLRGLGGALALFQAGMIAVRPGCRSRLIYRVLPYHGRKSQAKGFRASPSNHHNHRHQPFQLSGLRVCLAG